MAIGMIRTNHFCVILLLFCVAPKLILSVQCPSGFTCISGPRNVTVEWGYNGHLCTGQEDGQCYNGERDPRGFLKGPMQKPVRIFEGDRLFFKTTAEFAIQPFNVTRTVFYACSPFATENAVIPGKSSALFEIPNKYIDSLGIKYFIADTNNNVYQCQFGTRLEVFVHSISSCRNHSNAICSSKGLCAITNKFFSYNQSCVCEAGYSGRYCEEFNSCYASLNPCRNGATCVDKPSGLVNDYECKCMLGFTGKNCETNIDDCNPKPCTNNSVCVDGIASYTCLCPPGYNGKNCSKLVKNNCVPNPCENGGTCSLDENPHNYTCNCPAPFVGRNCSINSTSLSSSVPMVTSSYATKSTRHASLQVSSTQIIFSSSSSALSMVSTVMPSKILTSSSELTQSSFILRDSSFVSTLMPSKTVTSSSVLTQLSSILGDLSFVLTSTAVQPSTVLLSTVVMSTVSPIQSMPLHSVMSSKTLSIVMSSTISSSAVSMQLSTSSRLVQSSSAPDVSTVHPSSRTSDVKTVQPSSTTDVKTIQATSTLVTPAPSSHTVVTSTHSLMSSPAHSTSEALTRAPQSSATTHATTHIVATATSALPASSTIKLPAITTTAMSSVMSTASSAAVSSRTIIAVSSTKTPPVTQATTTIIQTPQSASVAPSPTTSVVMTTSTVIPTTVPPTTKPPIEQTCKDKPCNGGVCVDEPDSLGFNFTCQCPKPTYGPRCSSDYKLHFPRFSNNSYLIHKPIALAKGLNKIVITFKTTQLDGLLFYSTHPRYRDFIQLYITDGNLEYRFDPGDSLVGIRSTVKVNTGNIITAVVTYDTNNREGTLQVDNNPIQRNKARGRTVGIDLYNYWYIGGLPPGKSFGVNDNAKTTPTLHGCIRDIELNGDDILFTEAIDWNNLNECDKPCDHQPCHNGGNCTNNVNDPHEYQCSCPVGYEGKNCKKYTVCSGDPCKGGLCIPGAAKDSKTCLCPYGRAGINCENDLNITVPCLSMVNNYSSYIQYPVPTRSGPYFAVTLQFKFDNTSNAAKNSLLVYSGQDQYQGKGDDFVALGINDNRVVFQYELGSGIARITSDVLDSKLVWHSVTAGRKGKEGYLYVDRQPSKRGSSPGSLVGLNLYSSLYSGGVPEVSELPSNVDFRNGLQGCISNMAVRFGETEPFINLLTSQTGDGGWRVRSGRNVGDLRYSSCQSNNPCRNNGTCVAQGASVSCTCQDGWHGMFCSSRSIPCINHNPCVSSSTCREVNNKAVCDCPLGKTGSTCSQSITVQTPKFNENSYMAYLKNTSDIRTTSNIKITFKPAAASGLLFYVTHQIGSQRGDFLSISLHNGIVHYRYNLGSGVANLQSSKSISLNTQQTIEVTRSSKTGTLKLNNGPQISGTSSGSAVALDVESDFFVGGVPQLSSVNPSAVIDSSSLKDYVGCVSSIQINNVKLPLTEKGAKEGRNIENCPSSNPVVT